MTQTSNKRKQRCLNLSLARDKRICILVDKAGSSNEAVSSVHPPNMSIENEIEKREPEDMTELLNLSDTDNEDKDPSFDLDSSIKSDKGKFL